MLGLAVSLALARWAVAILVVGITARCLYTFYHHRMRFRSLSSKYGLVSFPSHSVVFRTLESSV